MNAKKNRPETSVVRWKPIAQAPSLGPLIVRCTDGSSRFVMRDEDNFYDPACEVQH